MATLIKEQGYKIKKQQKLDITTAESVLDAKGEAIYIHNAGVNTVYLDKATGVTSDMWEIKPSFVLGPLVADKLYFKGAGTSTLKVLFVEV